MVVLISAMSLGGADVAAAQAGPRLAELRWLEGQWVIESPDERLEEWWSSPAGNSMVGHFRWIKGERLWITEHLSITEEAGEALFRLRHFDASMGAWEDRDDPFIYRMSDRSTDRVAFTNLEPRPGRPTRFVFQALPGDSLLVRLEGEQGGLPTTQEFRFSRRRGSGQ